MDPPGELGRYKPHYGKSIETNVTLDSGNYRKKEIGDGPMKEKSKISAREK